MQPLAESVRSSNVVVVNVRGRLALKSSFVPPDKMVLIEQAGAGVAAIAVKEAKTKLPHKRAIVQTVHGLDEAEAPRIETKLWAILLSHLAKKIPDIAWNNGIDVARDRGQLNAKSLAN